jgi:hypothetical protein
MPLVSRHNAYDRLYPIKRSVVESGRPYSGERPRNLFQRSGVNPLVDTLFLGSLCSGELSCSRLPVCMDWKP